MITFRDNIKKSTILVVDDNQLNVILVSNILVSNNLDIIEAENGLKAIDLAKKNFPDLILLDIMMPGLNGYEVCKILKKDELTKNIPIIFLTAKEETENIAYAYKIGAVDYISKPFFEEVLIARINTHLKLKNSIDNLKKEIEINENYKALLEANTDVVFMFNHSGKLLFFNKQIKNLLGYSSNELINKSFTEIIPKNIKTINEAFVNNKFPILETLALHKNGNLIPVEITGKIIKYNQNPVIVGSIRDITERKIVEREMIETKNELAKSQRIAKLGSWEFNLDTQEINLSTEHLILLNETPKSSKMQISDYIDKYVIAEDISLFKEKINFALRNKKNKDYNDKFEYKVKTQNGKIKDFLVYGNYKSKGVIHGVTQDISETKQNEEELVQSRLFLNNVVNTMPTPLYVKDAQNRWVIINDAYCNLVGRTKEELIGETDFDLFFNNDEFFEEENKLLFESKKIHVKEERLINKHGNTQTILTRKSTTTDGSGNKFLVEVITDITDRKNAEIELKIQKELIERNLKKISDSINYAKRLQNALFPSKEIIYRYLPDSFILFNPKEQVSGDFYYVNKINDNIIFAVADCTGHGVPGGFLTILGITYLHEIVNRREIDNAGTVLNVLRERIKDTFMTFGSNNKDGLDIALCVINTKTNVLQFAGANNPVWIMRGDEMIEYKGTRNPIGIYIREKDFVNNLIQLQNEDMIYLFSDGYLDQFGGENYRKFTKTRFRELIKSIYFLPLDVQESVLEQTFEQWIQFNEQIDDVTIMGLKWKFI